MASEITTPTMMATKMVLDKCNAHEIQNLTSSFLAEHAEDLDDIEWMMLCRTPSGNSEIRSSSDSIDGLRSPIRDWRSSYEFLQGLGLNREVGAFKIGPTIKDSRGFSNYHTSTILGARAFIEIYS
ncbi:hypothetical protein LINPERPRIM_LOCUS3326 [Linum perenne]